MWRGEFFRDGGGGRKIHGRGVGSMTIHLPLRLPLANLRSH